MGSRDGCCVGSRDGCCVGSRDGCCVGEDVVGKLVGEAVVTIIKLQAELKHDSLANAIEMTWSYAKGVVGVCPMVERYKIKYAVLINNAPDLPGVVEQKRFTPLK